MGKRSYGADMQGAWSGAVRQWRRERTFTSQEFEKLKAAYVEKFGYAIAIPDFNDIIHWKSPAAMSEAELKALKYKRLQQVLASPSPSIVRSYGSIMTWLDNVQDAMTTAVVAAGLLIRWAPRVMSRAVPYLGWAMLAYDVMNVMNTLGRAVINPLGIKRRACEIIKDNPTLKQQASRNAEKLKRLKPSFGNLLEVLQTLDNVAGVGLCLGGVVGLMMDIPAALYYRVTGEKVTTGWDMPKVNMHEFLSGQAMKGAAMINSGGQTFDDELHFWTYVTAAGSAVLTAPLMEEQNLWEIVEDPMTTILPAPRPTDPLTLAVIQEAGLDVDAGCLWPANGQNEISMDELTDWQAPRLRESFQNFMQRHQKDWYGFVAGCMISQSNNMIFDSIDPGANREESYLPAVHVLMQMTKSNVWLQPIPSKDDFKPFEDWCNQFWTHYEEYPGIREVKNKLDLLGIPWTDKQPQDYPPEVQELFPPEALDETLWEERFE